MNIRRGLRRIAWVVVVAATPVISAVAYQLSNQMAGYEARLITSGFPEVDDPSHRIQVVDDLGDVGIIYFPAYVSQADVDRQLNAVWERAKTYQLPDSGRRQSVKEFSASLKAQPIVPIGAIMPPQSAGDFAASLRSEHAASGGISDAILVKRVLDKYPAYRNAVSLREFNVAPIYRKRLVWAAGVSALTIGLLALLLHGSIAMVSWVARGFTDSTEA